MISRSELELSVTRDLPVLSSQKYTDASITAVRSACLFESLFKKFEDDSNAKADEKAVDLFVEMNQRCRRFVLQPRDIYNEMILNEVRRHLYELFDPMSYSRYDYSYAAIHLRAEVGPGASVNADSYNFYTKMFDSPLSATSESLHRIYRYYCSHYSRTWYQAEMLRYYRHGSAVVVGNRLSTVPKNVDISRCIATEPTLNMYYQKGLGRILEDVLSEHFNIKLDVQPDINREMARAGSLSGQFATIDLKSASDSISTSLVSALFPVAFLKRLKELRSPFCRVGDRDEELYMISSMGNGFTFPLQTLIFACIVRAVYATLGIKPQIRADRNFSVFGDDIICETSAYDRVCSVLEDCGFIVNRDKSFNAGLFRESCGEDYFRGHNVRGVYVRSLKTRADINASYNKLMLWQCRSGIILTETNKLFRKVQHDLVPFYEDPSSGYYATSTILGAESGSFKALRSRPDRYTLEQLPYGFKYNPDGVLISVVGGYVRNGRITVRSTVPRFTRKRALSSKFDDFHRCSKVHKDFDPQWFTIADLTYD